MPNCFSQRSGSSRDSHPSLNEYGVYRASKLRTCCPAREMVSSAPDGTFANSAIRGIVRPSRISCAPLCSSANEGLMTMVEATGCACVSGAIPARVGGVDVIASIFDSYPSPAVVLRQRSTKALERAGGFFSHETNVRCGSQAETTMRAVTVAPSLV